ncbi:hypothetical protein MMC07_000145 [Pseudocyphellaria aurata]|nr:hypothetical protein [Pseudocyphellaria aurata]
MFIDYVPQAFYYYTTYYRPYEAYLRPLRRGLYLSQSYFYRYFFPHLYPAYALLQRILSGGSSGGAPDLASLALLALLALIALKLLDMVRKTVLYWIGVAVRLALWLIVAAVGVYVWQRGVEASVEDLGWVVGYLAGLGDEGERIGKGRAARREGDARRIPKRQPGSRRRTRGAGWS